MTREIKFKIILQQEETGRLLEKIFSYAEIFSGLAKEQLNNLGRWIIIAKCQFTGLHDKNGKEIYESDIIQTDVNLKKWIVYEEDYAWYVKNIGSNEKYPLGVYKKLISVASSKLEVIGNIYQNKTLLNI